eukprot:jgi/Ulvmu1/11042/UM007_0223.1
MLAVCRQVGSIIQASGREAFACSLSSRVVGRTHASRFCSTSSEGSSAAKKSLGELTQDTPSTAGKRLFQKVLDGQHVPVDDAAAANKPPSAAGRAFGALGNFMFYGGLLGAIGFQASTYVYTVEDVQKMDKEAKEAAVAEGGPVNEVYAWLIHRFCSAREWYAEKISDLTEPPSDVLLPDMHPVHAVHALRTLVLDVDDVLVRSTWSRGVGWKTFKRPGASDFLDVVARHFEVVTFSNRTHTYVDPILNRVDPGMARSDGPVVAYRLYRNACRMVDNVHVRDLSRLNRDLRRTLFIVSESNAHTVAQHDNVLVIPDWEDMNPDDRTLLDILPLLEIVSKQDVLDVRVVCRSYKDKDVVAEFRSRMEQADRKQAQKASQSGRPRFAFG